MNTTEQLENAHLLVIQTVDNLPESEWERPMSKDGWTVKDSIAHLVSYERILVDILNTLLGDAPATPYLSQFTASQDNFNATQVAARSNHTAQQVIDEYEEVQATSTALLARIPAATLEQYSSFLWFGEKRPLNTILDRLIRHVKLHCDEVTAFRTREKL